MKYSEELYHTREYHSGIKSEDVLGCWSYIPIQRPAKPAKEKQSKPSLDPTSPWIYYEDEAKSFEATETPPESVLTSESHGTSPLSTEEEDVGWRLVETVKQPAFERVLLRFVFEDVGLSLAWSRSARQLLVSTLDCLRGMFVRPFHRHTLATV